MPLNPALHDEVINSPIERSNSLNDPKQFVNQGYNTFDLTNQKALSARFGEFTPFHVFETLPGDRHMVGEDSLSLLNTIDASLISQVNEYHDYFYVPMRSVFPYNYEKMIANPTKGSDLPAKALPMIPLLHTFKRLLVNQQNFDLQGDTYSSSFVFDSSSPIQNSPSEEILLNNLLYITYALSRGQLLDFIGFGLDDISGLSSSNSIGSRYYMNTIQSLIEDLWNGLVGGKVVYDDGEGGFVEDVVVRTPAVYGYDLNKLSVTSDDLVIYPLYSGVAPSVKYTPAFVEENDVVVSSSWEFSSFRDAIYDCLEKGLFIRFDFAYAKGQGELSGAEGYATTSMVSASNRLFSFFSNFDFDNFASSPEDLSPEELFDKGFINPMRLVAYQQIVAEYGSNDSVDSVFTSELWMQNMRAIMFPSVMGVSQEPTFYYNGVSYEYDLFTTGSFLYAFNASDSLLMNKMLPFISNLFFLRRSLRYGDYFATGRPDFLTVGQLGINAESGIVDPVEVTQQILRARYMQATNWLGSRFDAQMAGIFNTDPSDTEAKPYFISHRKITLGAQEVNGTGSDNQGKRVTNLIGSSDSGGIDIYTDDFGVVLGLLSFDVLPLYPSGIDRNLRNYDRYTMYNAMLQNVGDQAITIDELTGDVTQFRDTFAYTTRYGQYKFPINKAHGAFVSDSGFPKVPVAAMIYPARQFINDGQIMLRISPEFIRDRPFYFDQFYGSRQNLGPAYYYHFALSVTNQHVAARRMQLIPQLLF